MAAIIFYWLLFDWFLPIVHQSEDVRIDDVTIINDVPRTKFYLVKQ